VATEYPFSTAGTATTRRTATVVGVASVVAVVVTAAVWLLMRGTATEATLARDLYVLTKTFVSFFTATVLVGVVLTYLRLYRDLPNRFTRTLLVITVSLLLYAIWANPVVWVVFDVEPTGIGFFTVLPDVFTAFAAIMLLQQSGM
jgi:cytochrome bd-type quinol oxidase subunit 2